MFTVAGSCRFSLSASFSEWFRHKAQTKPQHLLKIRFQHYMHLVLQATSMSASRDLQELWRCFSVWFTCIGYDSIVYQWSKLRKKKIGDVCAPRKLQQKRWENKTGDHVSHPWWDALSNTALQIITSYLATIFHERWRTLSHPVTKKKREKFHSEQMFSLGVSARAL